MKSKKGFTLIELLVVVLIIGILAAIAVPQYQKAVVKSRAIEALTVIKSLKTAIDEYILVNGSFPKTFNELSLSLPGKVSKYAVEGDMIIGNYYSFILVDCRLDVAYLNLNGYEPAFLYRTCENPNYPKKKEGLFCYYITSHPNPSERDKMCQQFSTSNIIEDGNVRYYKI